MCTKGSGCVFVDTTKIKWEGVVNLMFLIIFYNLLPTQNTFVLFIYHLLLYIFYNSIPSITMAYIIVVVRPTIKYSFSLSKHKIKNIFNINCKLKLNFLLKPIQRHICIYHLNNSTIKLFIPRNPTLLTKTNTFREWLLKW